ncbi:unnamed protein product [Pipistrellus nathusii]|uniref:Uncharacterized protein n=1 Tax=Pipistrellus nathusii TaxID=59473 RepID=A0ABN9ZYJ9_PIPNA
MANNNGFSHPHASYSIPMSCAPAQKIIIPACSFASKPPSLSDLMADSPVSPCKSLCPPGLPRNCISEKFGDCLPSGLRKQCLLPAWFMCISIPQLFSACALNALLSSLLVVELSLSQLFCGLGDRRFLF